MLVNVLSIIKKPCSYHLVNYSIIPSFPFLFESAGLCVSHGYFWNSLAGGLGGGPLFGNIDNSVNVLFLEETLSWKPSAVHFRLSEKKNAHDHACLLQYNRQGL